MLSKLLRAAIGYGVVATCEAQRHSIVCDKACKICDCVLLEWATHSVGDDVVASKDVVAYSTDAIDTLYDHVELDGHVVGKLNLVHNEVELAIQDLVVYLHILLRVYCAIILVHGQRAGVVFAVYGLGW